MNKNLEELKKVERFYCVEIKKNMIPLLEDFEKRLKKVEDEQSRKISGPIITKIISQEEK